MAKILLSLTPIAPARWETSPASGVKYLVAALSGERAAELRRDCSDMLGNLNEQYFTEKVCAECLKDWQGIGDAKTKTETACSPEAVKLFAKQHGEGEARFVVRRAQSIAHYVDEEVEAAKNG